MTDADLAIVDIAPFIAGDPAGKASVARAFGHAFETTGFAVVVGHSVPTATADAIYSALREFFEMPVEAKSNYTPPEQTKTRGYLPIGIESVAKTLTGETPPDLCEALVFNAPHRPDSAERLIWPDRPPKLAGLVREWTGHMTMLTEQLTRLSALALDLPEDFFRETYADPAITLRFVNYPDQPDPPAPGQLRYGEHHDYGALTILRQDSAPGGPEIRGEDGVWREAGVVPDSFVINVGDLLARWTNNRWRSTLHRVTNPPRDLTGSTARLSMVAFTGPNEQAEVACLPSCQSEDNPANFEPVICGEYIMSKLRSSMEIAQPS